VVRNGTATVLKLAYDTAEKASSPGTVLTGLMIKHLMTQETLTGLDFGRGDDSYKRDWTGSRRQRSGLVLAYPRDPAGLMAIARHAAGRMRALVLAR
jgi:CelD/BcsL family acetyltransferase involved in cellulose biosynthesis